MVSTNAQLVRVPNPVENQEDKAPDQIADLNLRIDQLSEGLDFANRRMDLSDERASVVRYSLNRIDQMIQTSDREMSRKSYSLEAEDLLVDNIYSNVLKRFQPGFYLDIGAAHPTKYSNTYFFYKLGWTGICVEPNPDFHSLYAEKRPHDTALNIGLSGSSSGILAYQKFSHPYINGFYGQDVIEWHKNNGQEYLGDEKVQCVKVADFLSQNVNRRVDFLNIDVETLDEKILSAWDWERCKPTIICAEIHASSLRDVLQSSIAKTLEAAGYTAVSRGWLSAIFVQSDHLKTAAIVGK